VRFGIFGVNSWACALDPAGAGRALAAAEAAGWESAWVGEHYALPDPPVPTSPAPPDTPMLDPLDPGTVEAYAAAGVDRLIVIPPGRARKDTAGLARWAEETAAALA
jgi:hypothetical protein